MSGDDHDLPADRVPVDRSRTQGAAGGDFIASFVSATIHSGPVPHPDVLRAYEELYPGSARLIIDAAMGQTKHRQAMESAVVKGSLAHERLGLIVGGVVALSIVAAGYGFGWLGSPRLGAGVIVTCLATLTGIFVFGTNSRRVERSAKAQVQKEVAAATTPQAATIKTGAARKGKKSPGGK